MVMKGLLVIGGTAFIVLCMCGSSEGQAVVQDSTGKTVAELTSESAAKDARLILGFGASKDIDSLVARDVSHITKMFDTTTPFVNAELNAREAWCTQFDNIELDFEAPIGLEPELRKRDFQVYVDASSDIVLKVTSRSSQYDSSVIRKPSVREAEEAIARTAERFIGLPKQQPVVSFRDALELVKGCPFRAMEIDAVYVIVSHPWKAPEGRPVWSIHLYGVDLMFPTPRMEGEQLYHLNHMRTVVDAMTGEVLYRTNSPQPK